MSVVKRFTVEKLHFPVDGYTHIVRTLTSVDNGKTFWYCGISKYFDSADKAEAYKQDLERGKTV